MDAKNIKCFLEWCKKHETMFSIVDFLTIHILGIVSFQIEIETIFSLVGIATNLKRCCLQSNNLEKLILVSKKLQNDVKVSCKTFSVFIKLIDFELDLG
jgi:hypothetical protein